MNNKVFIHQFIYVGIVANLILYFFYGDLQENQFKKSHMEVKSFSRIYQQKKKQIIMSLVIHTLEEKAWNRS